MKRALILGATGGIGRACIEVLSQSSNSYELVGVSRRPFTIPSVRCVAGDLRDADFRKNLVKTEKPQIVIAAYGAFPLANASYMDVLNEFTFSVIDLYERCEASRELEKFVVLSSLSALISGVPAGYSLRSNHLYSVSKRMLSDFFRQVQMYMESKSDVILVEPGVVKTEFAGIAGRLSSGDPADIINRLKIEAIEPKHIAEEISRAIEREGMKTSALTYFNRSIR